MTQWQGMAAADLGRGIANGEIDPVDLVSSYLDAIAEHPNKDTIYARLTPDRAMAEAEAARKRARLGLRRSPLDGVPVSWKDLFDTAGTATEAGSALLKDRVPEADARVLQNATQMGLVCLGKTHMSELAFSGLGLNPVTATPPNVHDPENAPGGSSSGAAASVAFGLAAAAVGSDTGGSVRIPSAWNDLVGLKTTSGLLSLEGVVPLCARFDTVGPLCRTVEDAALMLAALEGSRAPDLSGNTLQGVRLGVLKTVAQDDLRDPPRAGFAHAIERFQMDGAEVVEFEAPEVAAAMPLAGILYTAEAYGTWKDVIEAKPDLMYQEILARFRSGAGHSAPDYVAAWQKLDALRGEYHRRTAGFDAVVFPTSPITPPNVERLYNDSDYYVTENLLALRNTRIGNLMGGCGLTLPTGVPGCGVLLNAAPGAERRLLRLGAAAETALA